MNYSQDLIEAAKYLLKYQGQRGTDKQIEKLLKQVGPLVYSMAAQRGYVVGGAK